MLTPDAVRQKFARHYETFLRELLENKPFTALSVRVGKLPEQFSELRAAAARLDPLERERCRIERETRTFRQWGKQSVPRAVWVDSADVFLRLIDKQAEYEAFVNDVSLIRQRVPALEAWMIASPLKVIVHHGEWDALLEVCAYFQEHPQPALSMRELPIPVHTKFVETHQRILRELLDALLSPGQGESEASHFAGRFGLHEDAPLVRIRLLDNQLESRFGLALTDISLPVPDLNQLNLRSQRGLIVENKLPFLRLPMLPETFAIFGQGFAVEQLGQVGWLSECPLYYWGDLDAQGFQILALLRRSLPTAVIRAVLMDRTTFDAYAEYVVEGTPAPLIDLPELDEEERRLYRWLVERNLRLEQERIPISALLQVIIYYE
ncbi:MAG: hypothetical protein IAE80_07775 [Anaerolinea sp.]|nr:hypothetical protein [Anaerolinea sp.]